MFGKTVLRHSESPRPRRRRPACPEVEELEPRLTPAEVGVNDFRISFMGPDGNPGFGAASPAVAYNPANHEYLVVWSGDAVTINEVEIYGQRVHAATGALLGGPIRISDVGPDGSAAFRASHPAVAYNAVANEYLVVWSGDDNTAPLVDDEFEIFGQRLNAATGAEVGTNDFRISDMGPDGITDFEASRPTVVYNAVANEYLVVWHGDDDTGALVNDEFEIFAQRLTAVGVQVGTNDFRLSDMGPDGNATFAAILPSVAFNAAANEYLVVWEGDDNTAPLVDNEFEVFGQRLTAAGLEVGTNDFRLSDMGPDGNATFDAFDPAVTYNHTANEYLIVWSGEDNTAPLVQDEAEIFGQRLTAAGAEVGINDFRLSDLGPDGITGFNAFEPAVAYNSAADEYLVVWYGDDNTAPLVDNEFEVFGQRLTAAGAEVGTNDFRLSDMGPNGDPNFTASLPAVAANGAANGYLVVWLGDDTTKGEDEVFGQLFSLAGPPPPAPSPMQIVVQPFRRRGVAKVRIRDYGTGIVRGVLTPFKGFRGRLRLQLVDVTGDGSLDLVVKAVINGKRKKKVYDAVTLAPLPPKLT